MEALAPERGFCGGGSGFLIPTSGRDGCLGGGPEDSARRGLRPSPLLGSKPESVEGN